MEAVVGVRKSGDIDPRATETTLSNLHGLRPEGRAAPRHLSDGAGYGDSRNVPALCV